MMTNKKRTGKSVIALDVFSVKRRSRWREKPERPRLSLDSGLTLESNP